MTSGLRIRSTCDAGPATDSGRNSRPLRRCECLAGWLERSVDGWLVGCRLRLRQIDYSNQVRFVKLFSSAVNRASSLAAEFTFQSANHVSFLLMRRNATRTSNATSLGARPLVEFPKSTSRPSNFGRATPKTARKTLDFACRFFHELGFSVGSSDRPSKNHNFKKFFDRSLSDHLRHVLPGLRGSEPESPAERIKPVDLQKPIWLTGGPYL